MSLGAVPDGERLGVAGRGRSLATAGMVRAFRGGAQQAGDLPPSIMVADQRLPHVRLVADGPARGEIAKAGKRGGASSLRSAGRRQLAGQPRADDRQQPRAVTGRPAVRQVAGVPQQRIREACGRLWPAAGGDGGEQALQGRRDAADPAAGPRTRCPPRRGALRARPLAPQVIQRRVETVGHLVLLGHRPSRCRLRMRLRIAAAIGSSERLPVPVGMCPVSSCALSAAKTGRKRAEGAAVKQ